MTFINSTGTALSPNATESVVRGISDDIIVYDATEEEHDQVQKSTAYTWLDCCCLNAAQIVLTPPAPRNGGPFLPFFGQAGQVDPLVGWRSCY